MCSSSNIDSRRRLLSRLVCVTLAAVVSVLLFFPGRVGAEVGFPDRVTIRPAGSRGKLVLQCAIEDYTGRFIRLRTVTGVVKTYPAAQVLSVQTPQLPSHREGLLAFASGDFKAAAERFESALNVEERQWVRRELLGLLVRCALQQGRRGEAAEKFLLLVKSDPATRQFALIPLLWAAEPVEAALKGRARRWLNDAEPVPRLIAASLLLGDPAQRKEAEDALRRLRLTADARIRPLAELQLWRAELLRALPTADAVRRRQKHIEQLPTDLRGGGYYLLGEAHRLRREYEEAAAAYLWVSLVFDDDRLLAARSCLNAADALLQAGQKQEAVTLYREVQVRFRDTEFAGEATAELKKLAAGTKP